MSPTVLVCDGCPAPITRETAVLRGRLGVVRYCAACAETVDAALARLDARRAAVVRQFEAERAEALATLRATIAVLPDE